MNLVDMAKQIEGSAIEELHQEHKAELKEAAAEDFKLTHPEPSDMQGQLKTAEAAMAFIFAGNAYFTLRSKKTLTRFTYRVSRAKCKRCGEKECHCWAHPIFFVNVLTGSQNDSDYSYVGYIKDGEFKYGEAKARIGRNAPSVNAFEWAFAQLRQLKLPINLEVWHDGCCGRCGRKLTVPESVERGIGPECAQRM